MNSKFFLGVLRAPEGDGGTGGGGDAGATGASDSHEAAAAKVFGGGDGTPAAGGSAAPAAKPGDGKAGEAAAAAPKTGLLGKFGKKPEAAPAAGAKPGATAEADLPENKITLGDKAGDDTKKHFESLKGITKTLRGELGTRDARIKELESKVASGTALPADYDKLKAEHKAFSDRVAVLDLQSHPDFVRQFTEPKTKIVDALKTVLGDNKVEGGDLTSLLAKPRAEYMKAASEIAEKLPDYERFEFLAGARQLYQLSQQEREALGKSSELAKGLQAKTLESQRAAFGKTWEKLGGMGEFIVKLEADATATAEEKAAVDTFNKSADEVRANAEHLAFQPGGEEGVAQTAVKAASFDFFMQHAMPRMEAEYKAVTDLVAKLQDEVKQLRGGKGEAGGGGGGAGGGEKQEASHEAAARQVPGWR